MTFYIYTNFSNGPKDFSKSVRKKHNKMNIKVISKRYIET